MIIPSDNLLFYVSICFIALLIYIFIRTSGGKDGFV